MTEAEVIYNYTVKGMSLDDISREAMERGGYANDVVHRYGIPTRGKTTAWSGDSKGAHKAYLDKPKSKCIDAILCYISSGNLDGDWTRFYGKSTIDRMGERRERSLTKAEVKSELSRSKPDQRSNRWKKEFSDLSRDSSSDECNDLSPEVARWQLVAIILAIVVFCVIWNVASGLWFLWKAIVSFLGAWIVYGVVEYLAMLHFNKD